MSYYGIGLIERRLDEIYYDQIISNQIVFDWIKSEKIISVNTEENQFGSDEIS